MSQDHGHRKSFLFRPNLWLDGGSPIAGLPIYRWAFKEIAVELFWDAMLIPRQSHDNRLSWSWTGQVELSYGQSLGVI